MHTLFTRIVHAPSAGLSSLAPPVPTSRQHGSQSTRFMCSATSAKNGPTAMFPIIPRA
jgi:hypothetical protein